MFDVPFNLQNMDSKSGPPQGFGGILGGGGLLGSGGILSGGNSGPAAPPPATTYGGHPSSAGMTNATNSVAQAATSGVKGLTARLFGRNTAATTPSTNHPARMDNLGQTILEPEDNLSDKEIYPRTNQPHHGGPHQQGYHGQQGQQGHQNVPQIGELI